LEAVANGKQAVERVKATSFDVVVSDISMPEMSGLESLRSVRELEAPRMVNARRQEGLADRRRAGLRR
jgi:CheY-like chemotaxis protein